MLGCPNSYRPTWSNDEPNPTRIRYEAIEPIAESFGDLDPEIDARGNDIAKRSQWTGFHRIEQILWVRGTTHGTGRYARKQDPHRQFAAIQRRLGTSDVLTEYIQHTASALFAVPSGTRPAGFVGDRLFV